MESARILSLGAVEILAAAHAFGGIFMDEVVANRRRVKAAHDGKFLSACGHRQVLQLQIFPKPLDFSARDGERLQIILTAPIEKIADFAAIGENGVGRRIAVGDINLKKPLERIERIQNRALSTSVASMTGTRSALMLSSLTATARAIPFQALCQCLVPKQVRFLCGFLVAS